MHIYFNSTWTHVPQSIGQTEDKLFCCPSVTAILVQRDRFSPGAPQGSTGSWYPLHDSVVVVVVIVVAVVDVSVPVVVVPVVNVSVVVVDVVGQAPSPCWQSVGPAHALPFCCGCTVTT